MNEFLVINAVNDEEKLGGKINDDDKETIEAAIKENVDWLDQNQMAEKDEYDAQYKELEKIVQPIFSKLYGGEQQKAPGYDFGEDMPNHDEL